MEQDNRAGAGFALFDPHGDLALAVRDLVLQERTADLVYVDPADPSARWRFNPFAGVPTEYHSVAAAGIVEVFKKLWSEDWGPRHEHLLRNVAFTLLEVPGASFGDIPALLTDRDYRLRLARGLTNPAVRDFWTEEYNGYSPGLRAVVIAPLQNKVGALLTDPLVRRFFTDTGDLIDLRQIMSEGKILVANLDKGRLGEASAALVGSLLVSHIALVGLSRSGRPEEARRDFAVFLDEYQTFTTRAIANMLSELRKFRVSLVLAQQHLSQVPSEIRDAVFGNVGTIVAFRVGATDAGFLVKEFAPVFSAEDLIGLERFHICVRLAIDGAPGRAFSARSSEAPTVNMSRREE